ncbi:UDP-N-acetylmuramate--L-alanine ligase [Waterburya agarophytonicola K14]|uniref:UDP-N-acetylmuramate--L-alanine ligase n=1 Tax=Waterburya agarophytonicola KI4 TaxID=2874699 RepID=A0A964BQE4_9CYAN|nr:UDP-N-acetylmuramate--L-alanine ligase [Waterburya agarophytonicola]MCC0177693.1 UDP-N-acetylmuramate--L-alanine ligase [Waterburya agarophytonicola KI4]
MAGDKRVAKVDLNGKPFHFIGIGGIGMSALAYIVAQRQLPVSGSDLRSSHITDRLETLGVKFFPSQLASNLDFFNNVSVEKPQPLPVSAGVQPEIAESISNINQVDNLPQVVCSTAIAKTNPEYQAAIKLGCPIFHRSDLLAALIEQYQSIAVSGTHGKTTTSSLIGYMLFACDLDPTIIVGGEVDAWDGNARSGQGQYLVAEADESDGSLVKHHPSIGVITNIELDHPDRYQDIQEVIGIFQTFASQCNTLIGCIDDPIIREELALTISYSLDPDLGADYTAQNVSYHSQGSNAEIWSRGVCLGELELPMLGEHNLSNALAAIAVGRQAGLKFNTIAQSLTTFGGTKRRFEHRGEVNNIIFIDDYAHHPSEIEVTLAAGKLRVAGNNSLQRVVAIFQPHRYSRTHTFLTEFAEAFQTADVVVITDIYSAGEKNIYGISGGDLVKEIARQSAGGVPPLEGTVEGALKHKNVHYHASVDSIADFLQQQILQPGDLAMFLGAGNLNQSIPKTIALYQH